MLKTIRTLIVVGALVSCTSSVSTTKQYVYAPNIVATTSETMVPRTVSVPTKVVTREHAPKTTTLTLCTAISKITLPPLPDYSKTKYATNREAFDVLSNQIAELRSTIRGYNNKTTQVCKPYRVLLD
mgnify:FL=1|jgi:hypothetical protein